MTSMADEKASLPGSAAKLDRDPQSTGNTLQRTWPVVTNHFIYLHYLQNVLDTIGIDASIN